ncbi:MAG: CbbQ/NirQ/NorQ/GpvN family protein [Bacteriovoracaceae bacterium]|nr:CbbQ/NirQ/NorQ/GpvN family protein [Bacteriovoracaceae bacterium]
MNSNLPDNTNFSRPFYNNVRNEEDVFKRCHQAKLPLILKGPTGCGKSRFVDAMAFDLKLPLITVACNEDTSATDLIGRFLIKGNETVWQDGPLTRAVRTGALLYLDEVVEAREDVIVLIHSLSDYRRILYIDALSEKIVAPNSFQLILSYNPGYQKSFKELKPSTKQRFVSIEFGYAKPDIEAKIIRAESELDEKRCRSLVSLANKIRSLHELSLAESVSTRLLVNAAILINSGLNEREACEVAISNALSDDQDVIRALNDLVSLYM